MIQCTRYPVRKHLKLFGRQIIIDTGVSGNNSRTVYIEVPKERRGSYVYSFIDCGCGVVVPSKTVKAIMRDQEVWEVLYDETR